jgi:hypothetical protein
MLFKGKIFFCPYFSKKIFSGRTGPLALKIDLELLGATDQYELSSYDVVSLYPWVVH